MVLVTAIWLKWAASVLAKFFKTPRSILRGLLRACAHVGKARIMQDLRHPARTILDPESLFNHRLQVTSAPAHHAIGLHVGTGLHNRGKRTQLVIAQSAGRETSGQTAPPGHPCCNAEPSGQGSAMPPIRAAAVRLMPS